MKNFIYLSVVIFLGRQARGRPYFMDLSLLINNTSLRSMLTKKGCSSGMDGKNCSTPITTAPPDTPNDDFVVGAGCGSRHFEQEVSPHEERRINAVRGSLPWQVSIQSQGFRGNHVGGGTIIDKKWVLTKAYYLTRGFNQFSSLVNGLVIKAGKQRLSNTDGSEQKIKVKKVFVHPSYNRDEYGNDIALIQLEKELTFDNYAQPACLPAFATEDVDYAAGNWVTFSGWGGTEQTSGSDNLTVGTVPIVADADCKKAYPGEISVSMFCAGKLGVGGVDSCQGDGGGPAVKKVGDKFTVLGIVSWGIGCGRPEYPGVYTKVARFESWLKNTIYKFNNQ